MAICGPEIDPSGRCHSHPYVQLQRLSHRTGHWVVLLDSCPICTVEDASSISSLYLLGDGDNGIGNDDGSGSVISRITEEPPPRNQWQTQ